ncbi:MAG: NYN domain-containing protein [Thermodesulfobacteriota bacterium]|jgi:predicted RNA-binding protein with PIN domain
MSVHIAIDGYNLIGISSGIGNRRDIEEARNRLVQRLADYRKIKSAKANRSHKITVVFDGTQSGKLDRSREIISGIEVIFSRSGEQADLVLKEMAKNKREGLTLVTSDRDVANYSRNHGAIVVSSEEFEELLEMAAYEDMKGVDAEEEKDMPGYETSAKKGPARRLPKEERRKLKRIKKL